MDPLARALLWDLAGTLLVSDPVTGANGPLPGWEQGLPRLARDFRMVVSTGEESRSARALLAASGSLPFFEDVYGDLAGYGGKPHGEILRAMKARPECSLVIGDRLRGDLPADTEGLVLLLVNQGGEILTAGMIADLVERICAVDPSPHAAFRELARRAASDPDSIGPLAGGRVTAAWRSEELSNARLWIFEPDWLDGRRSVIIP